MDEKKGYLHKVGQKKQSQQLVISSEARKLLIPLSADSRDFSLRCQWRIG